MTSEDLLMAGTRILPLLAALVLLLFAAGCSSPQSGGTGPAPATTVPPTVSTPAAPLPSSVAATLSTPFVTTPSPATTPVPLLPGTTPPPVTTAAGGKFLVRFPWEAGKRWTLTTNFHDGDALDFVNFADPRAPVLAAADGTVIWAGFSYPDSFNTWPQGTGDLSDMGNSVILQHGPDTYTLYFHLRQERSPPVRMGETVPAGSRIGYQGDTGLSHGAHLHFAVVDLVFDPFPRPAAKPRGSWGFAELGGSNTLTLNAPYESQNTPA